jgi:hypothetical protein
VELRALDAVPNNLPVALSSFVGRERELAELGRLLEGERLVTLTGAGGCGKSCWRGFRMALGGWSWRRSVRGSW